MIWAIIKKWKYLILGVLAVVVCLSIVDPLLESMLRSSNERKRTQHQVIPRWQMFTNRECGYIVKFPSRPFENPYTLSNRQNVVSYRQFAAALGGSRTFMVATLVPTFTNTFTDEQIKMLLDKTTKSVLVAGDKLVAEREILIGANFGREIQVMKVNGSFITMRCYQVGHVLQQLTVSEPATNSHSTNIAYFLDSFRLISEE